MKSYKLYHIESKQIFSSRNVVFHEEAFPFRLAKITNAIADPFPDLPLTSSTFEIPHVIHQVHLTLKHLFPLSHSLHLPLN